MQLVPEIVPRLHRACLTSEKVVISLALCPELFINGDDRVSAPLRQATLELKVVPWPLEFPFASQLLFELLLLQVR